MIAAFLVSSVLAGSSDTASSDTSPARFAIGLGLEAGVNDNGGFIGSTRIPLSDTQVLEPALMAQWSNQVQSDSWGFLADFYDGPGTMIAADLRLRSQVGAGGAHHVDFISGVSAWRYRVSATDDDGQLST